MSLAAVPSTYAASIVVGGKAVVTNTGGDTVRIRESAGTDAQQVAEAHEGDIVTVLAGPKKDSVGKSWYKVQAAAGTGWMSAAFLAPSSGSSNQPAHQTPKLSGTAHVANTDGDPLNMRSGPSRDTKIVGTLPANTNVSIKAGPVTDSEGTVWYQVSANGTTGWVMGQYLAQGSAAAQKSAQAAQSAQPAQPAAKAAQPAHKLSGFARVANTDGDYLNVRSAASRDSRIVATLAPDTSVAVKAGPVTDSEGTIWYQISATGVTGWAMGKYLVQADAPVQSAPAAQPASQVNKPAPQAKATAQPVVAQPVVARQPAAPAQQPAAPSTNAPTSRGASIVAVALRYVGYRYRFGGTTPSGFDCSGFVYYVLNKAGVPISRDMGAQLASGPRVSSQNLQPGDLVCFTNTYKRGLSHVGIYIGNGRFVHAENESTGVTISALWSSYWAAHYYTAVRP